MYRKTERKTDRKIERKEGLDDLISHGLVMFVFVSVCSQIQGNQR